MKVHMALHEKQASYKFGCNLQDSGTQVWTPGDVACSVRSKTARHRDFHIQRNHTVEGLARKLESETKLAVFFATKGLSIDRDFLNMVQFKSCQNIEGKRSHARPDFHLVEESARLGAIVLVGNDEFAHRQYACDFQRLFNIANALEQVPEFKGVPLLYMRFNPHHFTRDGKYFDMPLSTAHELLFSTIKDISTVKPGVNLVYINYDMTDGRLDVFNTTENDYATLYEPCVVGTY